VEAASSLGLKTMVHANGIVPVQIALEAGCSSIEHGFFMGKQNLNFMADRQVLREEERLVALKNLEHQVAQMALARRLGVPIALGTDSGSVGVHHGSALVDELQLLLDAGFSMQADFIVVKGSPSALPESLKDIFRIHVGERFL